MSKQVRDNITKQHVETGPALQIQAMRVDRGWSEAELAKRLGVSANVVKQLQRPGRVISLAMMVRVADVFDVALMVRFVPTLELLEYLASMTYDQLAPPSFDDDRLRRMAK